MSLTSTSPFIYLGSLMEKRQSLRLPDIHKQFWMPLVYSSWYKKWQTRFFVQEWQIDLFISDLPFFYKFSQIWHSVGYKTLTKPYKTLVLCVSATLIPSIHMSKDVVKALWWLFLLQVLLTFTQLPKNWWKTGKFFKSRSIATLLWKYSICHFLIENICVWYK